MYLYKISICKGLYVFAYMYVCVLVYVYVCTVNVSLFVLGLSILPSNQISNISYVKYSN